MECGTGSYSATLVLTAGRLKSAAVSRTFNVSWRAGVNGSLNRIRPGQSRRREPVEPEANRIPGTDVAGR
jgi:hypothetical protein